MSTSPSPDVANQPRHASPVDHASLTVGLDRPEGSLMMLQRLYRCGCGAASSIGPVLPIDARRPGVGSLPCMDVADMALDAHFDEWLALLRTRVQPTWQGYADACRAGPCAQDAVRGPSGT